MHAWSGVADALSTQPFSGLSSLGENSIVSHSENVVSCSPADPILILCGQVGSTSSYARTEKLGLTMPD